MENNFINYFLPPVISLIITSAISIIIGVTIEKYKNRSAKLYYTLTSQKITSQISNSLGNNLKIFISGKESNFIKVFSIIIENSATIDIENLIVRFHLNAPAKFQGNEAYILSSFKSLFWTSEFLNTVERTVNDYKEHQDKNGLDKEDVDIELQNRIDILDVNREYIIPVLNRKEKAVFNFLIEDPYDNFNSNIIATVYHKSVSLIKKNTDEKEKQIELWKGIIIGIMIIVIVISLLCIKYTEQSFFIILSSIIGFSYSIVGVLTLYIYRKIRDFIK